MYVSLYICVWREKAEIESVCVCQFTSIFATKKLWVCLSVCECLTVPALESSSTPQNTSLLACESLCVHVSIKVCVLMCACVYVRVLHVAAAQDVSPVLFMLDWLTHRVPQSCHMTVSASHRGPCDRAAQMRRHASACLCVFVLIIAWLQTYCLTDILPTLCVSVLWCALFTYWTSQVRLCR